MKQFWFRRGLILALLANLAIICFLVMFSNRNGMVTVQQDVVIAKKVDIPERGQVTEFPEAASRQLINWILGIVPHRVTEVSCARLFDSDEAEQMKAISLSRARPVPLDYRNDEFFAQQKCASIRERFVTKSLSAEESNFPIAFSLVVFKDFYQVEKLFRAVYRPEHFYCIHVDSKSSDAFYQAVNQYASCFENVALPSKRADVSWGRFSVLEAELICMEKLLQMSTRWLYFINLTGQEYPLRTMLELVRILKALSGANNMENAGPRDNIAPLKVKIPGGNLVPVRWYKGSVHITATRGFIEFALSDTGRQISDHLRRFGRWPVPDEMFFATLNNNPSVLMVPGADKSGRQTDNVRQPFLNRYKNWIFGVFGYPCHSMNIVRQICIWGARDLPAMNRRFELFVNKFYYNFERFGLECMEERFWNNTLADYNAAGYSKTHTVQIQFYSEFEFVKNHL